MAAACSAAFNTGSVERLTNAGPSGHPKLTSKAAATVLRSRFIRHKLTSAFS